LDEGCARGGNQLPAVGAPPLGGGRAFSGTDKSPGRRGTPPRRAQYFSPSKELFPLLGGGTGSPGILVGRRL